MKSELVELDVAAFSGEGVGIGGEAIDSAPVSELEDVGGEIGLWVEELEAEMGDREVKDFGPFVAVFKVKASLDVVAGGDPDVEPGAVGAGFHDRIECIGFGGTNLAGLLHDSEWPVVTEPSSLSGEEPSGFGKFIFGRDRPRQVEIGGDRLS